MFAQEPDSASALYSLRDAERSFAKASVMYGRKAAFAEFLAEKAIIFTDKWITDGKQLWQGRNATPVILKWEPEFADISAGGDFGVSTGPWEAQEYRPNTAAVSTGYFLSAWEKQKDGQWKVILDAGTHTPSPTGPLHAFSFPVGSDRMKVQSVNDTQMSLEKAENGMLASWKKQHSPEEYESFLRDDARIMKEGQLPTKDKANLTSWLKKNGNSYEWKQIGSVTASSGDVGFTYGDALLDGKVKGNYVRIWKRENGSGWKILIDLLSLD
jgi:ketosteroid isomerase-like protein